MTFHIIACTADAHAAAVREIFNDAILNTTALYEYQPLAADRVLKWFGGKARRGDPVIAALDAAGRLLGFATYGPFRDRPAYKYTVEHSVYVHRDHRRRGVGRALLLRRLIRRAEARELHLLVGGIDVSNAESICAARTAGLQACRHHHPVGLQVRTMAGPGVLPALLCDTRPVDG